jgi:hypothetical protein
MIVLTQGATSDKIIVTLDEKKTLPNPIYRFVCTDTNNNIATFDINSTSDLSTYKNRYNEFEINTSIIFADMPAGKWQYIVTELTSNVVVELGKLELKPSAPFAFGGYKEETTYKGYGG